MKFAFAPGSFTLPGIVLLSLVMALSCRSGKVTTPENFTGKILTVGHGGGFTGAQTSYLILENGQVFKQESMDKEHPLKDMKALSESQVKDFFAKANDLNLTAINLNKPGNMYYYIEIKENNKPHRITWNERQEDVPQQVVLFYDQVLKALSEQNP